MIAGIDAGKEGAITILSLKGEIVDVYDMPLIGKYIDSKSLFNILVAYPLKGIAVEKQFILKQQRIKGNFTIGVNYGKLMGVGEIVAPTYPIVISTWRAYYKLPKSKDKVLQLNVAKELSGNHRLINTHDRGDSFLIANYFLKGLKR